MCICPEKRSQHYAALEKPLRTAAQGILRAAVPYIRSDDRVLEVAISQIRALLCPKERFTCVIGRAVFCCATVLRYFPIKQLAA